MLRRTGFRPKLPPRPPATQIGAGYTLRPRSVAVAVSVAGPAQMTAALRKEQPLQHQGYMDAVRGLACHRCGRPPRSQFCHSDEGKGAAIKSDCRLGWPGCAECHHLVGSTGRLGKAGRREYEARAARTTRALVRALGAWPATLPAWPEDEVFS
jgi:hypothetical protein